ncbi:DUF2244 domain-containing protein [Rubellimicrobium sp. CFH 75288]|uniref:DUF2244 domain-containing protein n=1 Tax=Rubellimicrobium sp. CFH 75288 TaxID=2697034 RepID=UPI0014122965|nr:DUF2244 domain-containing protein [Rubellimicrobium sp. CFH 75288]NAZ35772.1 DUF2244 domain-containing protein [Rubellimicrobium sp. CFH 75288]
MPYAWLTRPSAAPERSGAASASPPAAVLRLWPHRSLPLRGFAGFIGITAALLAVPLLPVLGSPVLWGLLPFLLAALAGLWWALRLSYRSGEVLEELRLWPDRIELERHDPFRPPRRWEANPHWVRTAIHPTGGPVPHYLTLTGAGRTVEIGAFLSEEERLALRPEIEDALARLR